MNQLKIGAILSYISIAVNILTGLLYMPWMINSIGKENYGLYTLAMSVIGLFVFDFGLSSAITRFISKYLAEGKFNKANECLGLIYRLYFVIDIFLLIIFSVAFFLIPTIYKELTPSEISTFKNIYVLVSVYSILSFPFIPVNGVLTAHEKFIQLKICDIIHKLLIVGAMTICLLLGYGLYALVMVNIIAGLIMIAMKLWSITYYTRQKVEIKYYNSLEFKEILNFSGWTTVVSLSQRCIFNIAPTILGALSGSTAIAILGVAMTIEGYTYTFSSALSGMFLPKVSRILSSDNSDVLPLMIRVGRIQLLLVGLITVIFICVGRGFIHLWVGEQFDLSYICSVLIIVPSVIQLPQEIGLQAIVAANKVKIQAYVFMVMAVFNVIVSLILAPHLGALGICISVTLAYIIRTIGLDYILVCHLRINIWRFFKETYLKILLPILLSLLLGLLLVKFFPVTSWSLLILDVFFILLNYCLLVYYLSMNNEEKQLVLQPFVKLIDKF